MEQEKNWIEEARKLYDYICSEIGTENQVSNECYTELKNRYEKAIEQQKIKLKDELREYYYENFIRKEKHEQELEDQYWKLGEQISKQYEKIPKEQAEEMFNSIVIYDTESYQIGYHSSLSFEETLKLWQEKGWVV